MKKVILLLLILFSAVVSRSQPIPASYIPPLYQSAWVAPNPDWYPSLGKAPLIPLPPFLPIVRLPVKTQDPSDCNTITEKPLKKLESVWLPDNQRTSTEKGVSKYNSAKAQNGVTLLDEITKSKLIDMNGKVLGNFPVGLPLWLSDGTLLGRMGLDLVKFDEDLNMIWRRGAAPHHEITSDEKGNVYLLSTDTHQFMGLNVNFDVLEIFSPDGVLIYEWHVFDHLEEFVSIISKSAYLNGLHDPYDPAKGIKEYISQDPERFFWHQVPVHQDTAFEFTHFNSIQVLPENEVSKKIPAFKKGNLLLSFNPYSCYGILNTSTGKIEWVGYLPERTTLHTPLLTPTGTILVYQNSTKSSLWENKKNDPCLKYLHRKLPPQKSSSEPQPRNWVSITEYNLVTNAKVWEYTATPKESLQGVGLGCAQRLSNGNTLVCVATDGTGSITFEVTPEKEIVWNYVSPEKDPANNTPLCFYRAKRISLDIAKKIIPGFKQ